MRNVAVRCAAVRAPASIAAQAADDDRLVADRCPCAVFTATPTALGNSAAASATHRSSPDTNATGAPNSAATPPYSASSPASSPLTSTRANAVLLIVCASTPAAIAFACH